MTRKEAIGRIQEHIRIHSKKEPFTPYLDKAFDMAIEALNERPHGEWEYTGCVNDELQPEFCCSICNFSTYSRQYNFCPNCGTDMREGDRNE